MKDDLIKEVPLDTDELIELNKEYCVVRIAGKTRVLTFREEMGRQVPEYLRFDDFRNYFLNRSVLELGKNKPVELGKWWLHHEGRRQYKGVIYEPSKKSEVNGCLNLWQDWAVKPKKGDWSLMRRHIEEVLAAGNKEVFDYIIKWTAWLFQNPGTQAEVALVLQGNRGTGRGIFARSLCRIFGQHALHISSSQHMTGRFNDHLQDCSLLFADEAIWPGDKTAEGALQRMITEPGLFVELKFGGKFMVKNNLHVLMASNYDWVFPAGMDERRIVAVRAADTYKQNEAWFTPLYQQMGLTEDGSAAGCAAMLYDLLKMDLSDWHPRKIIHTEALMEQKLLSLDPEMSWWLDVLEEGRLPFGCQKTNQCPTVTLYDHYVEHVHRSGRRYPISKTRFGQLLHKRVPELKKLKDCNYKVIEREKIFDQVGYIYEFPTLKDCRSKMDSLLSRAFEAWTEPGAEWSAQHQE
jgi:hypothetical protein